VQPDIYVANAGTHGPNPDRFFAAVKYIVEYQPRVVVLEDLVAACREDNAGNLPADAILALLEQSGDYEVDAYQVASNDYGLPQRRHRFYYIMIQKALLRSRRAEVDPLKTMSKSLESLRTYFRSQDGSDADQLIEQCSPDIGNLTSNSSSSSSASSSHHLELSISAGSAVSSTNGANVVSDVDGLLAMSSDVSYLHRRLRRDLDLGQDDHAYFTLAGRQLTRWLRTYREADLCEIHWLRARDLGREIRFVSTSQDAHRASTSCVGDVPALAANTRLWSYRLQRIFTGREMLLLQGFRPDNWGLEVLSEAALCRVAGSAMSVHGVAAVLASVMASVDFDAVDANADQVDDTKPSQEVDRLPVAQLQRWTAGLSDLRSRYAAIRRRMDGLRRKSKLGA